MTRKPYFQIVRTDAGWHLRFVAANGRKILFSEVYEREAGARNALRVLADCCDCAYGKAEVREIDERAS